MGEGRAGSGGSSERDLIARAFGQADATPRPVAQTAGDLPPADSIEGYDIVRSIHRGGQGSVYLAVQSSTKRRVAIKVLHGGAFAGSTGRARFDREIQILGQLNHPNIVKIHDSGRTASGEFFYVMDYISGRGLDELIREGSDRASIPEVLALFIRLCEGVNAAHLRGVIHRDLKPQNVRVDANGEPIVVDFGLAKVAVPDVVEDDDTGTARLMSMTGQFVGSLPWASPEQATGSPGEIDMRSDVYSLGVMLYQFLTGRFPYEVIGNMRDVLDNILKAEPARPSTIRRRINDEVETIVLKCLHKDKERRYQSAGELARDLRHYLDGEPIEAKRDSGWYVISKTLRRHRGAVTFAGVVAVLVVGWSISSGFLLARERTLLRAAQTANANEVEAREAERGQRLLAQSNAQRVRGSFRRFIEDFDGRLGRLRGTTRVREEMLSMLFTHVEELEARADGAGGFDRDLADGQELYAVVLAGIHYNPTVGRSDEASALLESAIGHRRIVLAANPEEARAHAELGRTLAAKAGLEHNNKRFDRAIQIYGDALEAYDEAAMRAGDGPSGVPIRDERMGVRRQQADARRSSIQQILPGVDQLDALSRARTRYMTIEQYWSDRVGDGFDWRLLRELGVTRDKIGVTFFEAARVRIAQASDDDDWTSAGDRLTLAFDELSRGERWLGQAREALDGARLASPMNDQIKRDLTLNRLRLGNTLGEMANAIELSGEFGMAIPDGLSGDAELRDETLAGYKEALVGSAALVGFASEGEVVAATDNLDASAIDDVQAWRMVAVNLNKVGNARRELGMFDKSLSAYEASLRVRRILVEIDPSVRHKSDLVVGLSKIGAHAWALAGATTGEVRMAHLRRALDWTKQARAKVGEMVEAGEMEPTHGYVADLDGDIERLGDEIEAGG